MHRLRTASMIACTALVVLLLVPALAGAAVAAPALQAPEASAPAAREGSSQEFSWTGELQGDADALSQSFFRLELIKASEMPAGAQAAWPEASLENFFQTEPGQVTTSATIGVPGAGDYRWRVCAWGVVDDTIANEITQLPGGCSAPRKFATVAAATSNQAIGELKVEETKRVDGQTRFVDVVRDVPAPAPKPAQPAPKPVPVPEAPLPPASFTGVNATDAESGGLSAVGFDADALDADSTASREGIAGAVLGSLNTTLPIVPIPFWTLALLLAAFPILRLWRRSMMNMFEWGDGSIDGRGTTDESFDDLPFVPDARTVKVDSMTADGTAAAPAPVANPLAPDRGRRAA